MPHRGNSSSHLLSRGFALSLVVILAIGTVVLVSRSDARSAQVIPPPALDEAASTATTEVAVLAGGCFWGVQGKSCWLARHCGPNRNCRRR